MPRRSDPGATRDAQRAAWKAQGLTARGTPYKRRPDAPRKTPKRLRDMTPHELAAHRMVLGKRAAARREAERAAMNAADRLDAERRAKEQHDTDPRVVLFREEKQRRDAIIAAKIEEAKRELARQMAEQVAKQRGGRPRKVRAA